jgi:hypothetical protein
MCDQNNLLFRTGTEKTMNILIPNAKTFNIEYNYIKKRNEKLNYEKIKILHFKGEKDLENNQIYLDIRNDMNYELFYNNETSLDNINDMTSKTEEIKSLIVS